MTELWIEVIEVNDTKWHWLLSERESYAGRHLNVWGDYARTANAAFRDAMAQRTAVLADREIEAQATDYSKRAWDRAMTNGAGMERRFADKQDKV